jgi:predicted DCC family thiol-disulfide oxidoreductase YuxK
MMKKLPAYSYRDDPAVPEFPDDRPIIVFDNVCALCSGWVKFVLRHDQSETFRLLPAQSPLGKAIYQHYGLNSIDYESNILIAHGIAWFKSEGSIRMAENLGFPWRLAVVARVLPLRARDPVYSWIARNRYRWFGRLDTCYVPAENVRNRFLD